MEMALRIEAQACALLIAMVCGASAADYPVRHRHLRNGAPGTITVDERGIAFAEPGKHAGHSRTWKFEDIERLTLGRRVLRILTYENVRFRGDREFVFDELPERMAAQLYPAFSRRLDSRFVAALADPPAAPWLEIPARLLRGNAQGELLAGADRVVFRTGAPEQSRTWRIGDIESVSSAGRFDLTIVTGERDFRLQLKRELTEAQYNRLWKAVNQAKGLQVLNHE
jgi:hypothetical protein